MTTTTAVPVATPTTTVTSDNDNDAKVRRKRSSRLKMVVLKLILKIMIKDSWGDDDDYLPTDGYTHEQDQYYYGDIDNDPIDGDI